MTVELRTALGTAGGLILAAMPAYIARSYLRTSYVQTGRASRAGGREGGRPPRRPGGLTGRFKRGRARPSRSAAPSRPPAAPPARDDIGRAVNVGSTLAAALPAAGVATVADLRTIGAIPAWERLRHAHPRLATAATLLNLDGATRGITVGGVRRPPRHVMRRPRPRFGAEALAGVL